MKPQFTPSQLTRQERWRREEKFSWVSTILSIFLPFMSLFIPAIIPFAGSIMTWVDVGLTANRNKVLADEQKALNAQKKTLILEKDAVLTQLAKFDATSTSTKPSNATTNKQTHHSAPTNIKAPTAATFYGGITKKRHIDTALVKPTNVILGALKNTIQHGTPLNVGHSHKR